MASVLTVGLILLATLTVTASAGAAHGDATSPDLLGNTTDELNETTEVVNETSDEFVNTTDDIVEDGNELLGGGSDNDSLAVDDELAGVLNATNETVQGSLDRLTDAVTATEEVAGSISLTLRVVATDVHPGGPNGSADASEPATSDRSDSSTDRGPEPRDVVDAGLVGLLGGLTLLGGGSGASGSATGSITGHVSESVLRRIPNVGGLPWNKLPLSLLRYSRYDDSDPLAHETRHELYEAIEDDPGRYLTVLETDHDVSLSTIRHHLSVLEDEGLVETEKQNGKRRYYPAHTEDIELAAALDEPAKKRVIGVLAETGEVYNGYVADALDIDPSTVSHHLSALEDDGLVERRRDGRTIVNTLAPGVESAYENRSDSERGADANAGRVHVRGDD